MTFKVVIEKNFLSVLNLFTNFIEWTKHFNSAYYLCTCDARISFLFTYQRTHSNFFFLDSKYKSYLKEWRSKLFVIRCLRLFSFWNKKDFQTYITLISFVLESLNALKLPAKLVLFPLNKDIFKSRTSIVEDNLIDKPSSWMLILRSCLPISGPLGFEMKFLFFFQRHMIKIILM